jgi:hypothetical protein
MRVVLSFSANGLKDLDVLSKSDPQLFLYVCSPVQPSWAEVGRTEKIMSAPPHPRPPPPSC